MATRSLDFLGLAPLPLSNQTSNQIKLAWFLGYFGAHKSTKVSSSESDIFFVRLTNLTWQLSDLIVRETPVEGEGGQAASYVLFCHGLLI